MPEQGGPPGGPWLAETARQSMAILELGLGAEAVGGGWHWNRCAPTRAPAAAERCGGGASLRMSHRQSVMSLGEPGREAHVARFPPPRISRARASLVQPALVAFGPVLGRGFVPGRSFFVASRITLRRTADRHCCCARPEAPPAPGPDAPPVAAHRKTLRRVG